MMERETPDFRNDKMKANNVGAFDWGSHKSWSMNSFDSVMKIFHLYVGKYFYSSQTQTPEERLNG